MNFIKPFFACFVAVSVYSAQGITISGKVTDTGGTPIPQAAVKLEKMGITTTTGADGNFTLTSTGINGQINQSLLQRPSVKIYNGLICVKVTEKSVIEIITFNLQGKAVSSIRKTVDAGTNSIVLPQMGAGVYLYKVKAGKSEFIIKSPLIDGVSVGSVASAQGTQSTAFTRIAKSYVPIDDVIAVTKDGYLNYRVIVTNSDTSGIEVKMIVCEGTVTDADGNIYQTVRIGNQVWTVENLRTTRYNDGSAIPLVTDKYEWRALTTPGYCYYNNTTNADSIKKYGALYNWFTVDTKKLAPAGWHVPSYEDWDTLQHYLIANGYNWDGTTDSNRIAKSMATKTDWCSHPTLGVPGNDLTKNNRTGFSGLPGGYRFDTGDFTRIGCNGHWWSATEYSDESHAFFRYLFYGVDYFLMDGSYKSFGFSVRLLKGSPIIIKPTITSQPQSKTVRVGQMATFWVIATGTKPFEYKWQKDNTDIAGATDSSYTTPVTVTGDSGSTYRCIASNSAGADTSNSALLKVTSSYTITDIDGNVYHTVTIGDQTWLVENLKTTRYNDGTPIPQVTDSAAWIALTTPGYCYYENTTDTNSIKKYGALYNWYAVDTKKLAPAGWHVPTDAEWDSLLNYLIANGYNWDGTTTGNKVAKALAANTDWWPSTSPGAPGNDLTENNNSGFSALPSGERFEDGGFWDIGKYGYWWSATEFVTSTAYGRALAYFIGELHRYNAGKSWGISVRLVRNNVRLE